MNESYEGKVIKGGVNDRPTTPRPQNVMQAVLPTTPRPQNVMQAVLVAVEDRYCRQINYCPFCGERYTLLLDDE